MTKYSLLQYLTNPKSWTELALLGTLSHFLTSIVAKHQQVEGGPLVKFFRKKYNAEKTKGEPFSLSRYCMLRGKRAKNFFGSVRYAK